MEKYYNRLIDNVIRDELKAFGAVLISGPKWCGKTTSAKQIAQSICYMQDPIKGNSLIETAKINPLLLLDGEKPRLIDEWQLAPELWDAVRFDVDEKNKEGLYILTGSNTVDETKIKHSGAGRISRLMMRTMSLFESGDSNGTISLSALFNRQPFNGAISKTNIEDISKLVCRGGWPNSVNKDITIAMKQVSGYVDTISKSEIKTIDGVERDYLKAKAILRSIARNVGTATPDTTILQDVISNFGSLHINTLSDYLKALRSIYVIEDLPAWSPQLRSKTNIRLSDTRYFVDPAIAAALLGATPKDLFFDIKTFGFLFESLVIRDLRIYAQSIDGSIYRYKDRSGLEVDAIIHLNNGKWAAAEIKLGSTDIDHAAKNLLKLKEKIDIDQMHEPEFLMVITGTEYGYQRPDGVYVVPIGCLKD